MTRDEFIKKAKAKHGEKYDYSKIKLDYKSGKDKVIIGCPIHGDFEQMGESHLYGYGCNKCAIEFRARKIRSNNSDFIEKAKIIHGDRYDYSLVEYKSAIKKIKIICGIHGVFEQNPNDHLNKHGCPHCGVETVAIKRTKNTEYFINLASGVHRGKYDYSNTVYVNNRTKVIIICPEHGEFIQKPNSHLNGQGCPVCNESSGEKKIKNFLLDNSIKYVRQKTFDDCIYKKKLQFDFYLDKYSICVEYDGIQHFEPVILFGGLNRFNDLKIKDNIKTKYCLDNGIKLIRIPYTEYNNTEEILIKELEI